MFTRSLLLSTVFLAGLGSPTSAQTSDNGQGYPMPGLPGISVAEGLDGSGNVASLLIYQNGQQVQSLDVCTANPVPRLEPVGSLNTTDFNFDGSPDLALQVSSGKGDNKYCVWLFDPGTQRFVLNRRLSDLPNPAPDPKTKTVQSTEVLGCNGACFTKRLYKWSGRDLEMVRSETRTRDPLAIGFGGCDYILSISETRNGEPHEVSRERVNASGVRCDR